VGSHAHGAAALRLRSGQAWELPPLEIPDLLNLIIPTKQPL